MTNWPQLCAETHAEWMVATGRAKTAERWLAVHKWIFLPLAFVVGFVIGTFA